MGYPAAGSGEKNVQKPFRLAGFPLLDSESAGGYGTGVGSLSLAALKDLC